MKKPALMLIAFTGFTLAIPAYALDYGLQRDLGVQGLYHLCLYSNGKVYSFSATELCPLQIHVDEPPTSNGFGASASTPGFYIGEYQDGMTKVCIYNVLGAKRAVRISSASLCPQTYQF